MPAFVLKVTSPGDCLQTGTIQRSEVTVAVFLPSDQVWPHCHVFKSKWFYLS